jgi:hypothetical protein
MTQWRPSRLPLSAISLAPLMVVSSSAVATSVSGCFKRAKSNVLLALNASARKLFMSQLPSP